MKFKMMAILSIALLAVLTLGAVCAADNNATDEVIGMENAQNSDVISFEQSNSECNIEDDSNQSLNSDYQSKDLLGNSIESEEVLAVADTTPVLGATVTAPVKLSASNTEPAKLTSAKKTKYIKFKGKSKYSWKIKKTTWNKMKKQAKKEYYSLHKAGSSLPGYSKGVKVTVTRNGHKYKGIAFAVKNYRGIRCEVRRVPNVFRISNWGDTY